MFLPDKPYISDFFKTTLEKNQFPVIETPVAKELLQKAAINFISEDKASKRIKTAEQPILYTNSENAIAWMEKHLEGTDILKFIRTFKDKAGLRERLKPMYPNYFFKRVRFDDLPFIAKELNPYPIIIKPSVGFFSLGVRKVSRPEEYDRAVEEIKADMKLAEKLYPKEVIADTSFLIEEVIEGDEFAIDFYYDNEGKPVILNITQHLFASEKDMSDRAYITSKEIIETHFNRFVKFLIKMGELLGIKNFPAHIEIRKTADNEIIPIEVNPLRFGGWCTTADLAYHAYGINLYEIFYRQGKVNFDEVLKNKGGKTYSLIILDNSTGVAAEKIERFDYEALLSRFENPLELRKIDHREFPLFGFLFTETSKENFQEIEYILKSRLNEFI